MTRLTGGIWRGRQLVTPRSASTRPTTSMVREAIFNVLGDAVRHASVVDLCAGSGALGLEALSRGAFHVVMVDHALPALAAIVQNAEKLNCQGAVVVQKGECIRWAEQHQELLAATDICFMDPPYRPDAYVAELLLAVATAAPLRIVVEHHSRLVLDQRPGMMELVRNYRYGATAVSIFARQGTLPPAAREATHGG